FFFSSRRRHTRFSRDWSSDVCSSDLGVRHDDIQPDATAERQHGEALRQATAAHNDALLEALKPEQDRLPEGYWTEPIPEDAQSQIGRASCRERVEGWVSAGWWILDNV